MRILHGHFFKEFGVVFLSAFGALIFVFFSGRGFLEIADLVLNKDVSFFLVLKLFFYTVPFLLVFIIPMSVLIASLLTFGRLSHDNEITAARASGVSLLRLSVPFFIGGIILSLASFLLSDRIASAGHYAYRRLLARIGIESPGAALEEGTFIKKFKNFVIFVYEIDKNKLKGIRIYEPREDGPTRTIIAQKGELISLPEENILKLRLMHGTSDEPDPKDPSKLYKLNFKTYDLPLNLGAVKDASELGKKPKDMSVRELREEIRRLNREGIPTAHPLNAEIHNKLAIAFSNLAFLLIGIPLGITTRRSEKSLNFAMSLVLMSLYWTLLIGGKAVAEKGLLPPFLSLQFCNFVVGGFGLFLFSRAAKR